MRMSELLVREEWIIKPHIRHQKFYAVYVKNKKTNKNLFFKWMDFQMSITNIGNFDKETSKTK